jgi:hypothetical protein
MPMIETIKAAEAPSVPKKQSKWAEELTAAVSGLKRGEALRITPEEGMTVRGLKTGIGRITKGAGLEVSVWDDGERAYITKA